MLMHTRRTGGTVRRRQTKSGRSSGAHSCTAKSPSGLTGKRPACTSRWGAARKGQHVHARDRGGIVTTHDTRKRRNGKTQKHENEKGQQRNKNCNNTTAHF